MSIARGLKFEHMYVQWTGSYRKGADSIYALRCLGAMEGVQCQVLSWSSHPSAKPACHDQAGSRAVGASRRQEFGLSLAASSTTDSSVLRLGRANDLL